MRKILVIGIGAGNPDYLTVQAIEALNRADVFFIPDKGTEKAALRLFREEVCARFIREPRFREVVVPIPRRAETQDYRANVADWHAAIEASYERLFAEALGPDETGAFLVWGDPAVYDSTLRLLDSLLAKGVAFEHEVIPGIGAIQALAAQHKIPLNRIAEPVLITTGRRLDEDFPRHPGSVVVMLDGTVSFTRVPEPETVDIYWGAYLGTKDEILVAGRLSEVRGEIERLRAEARERHGWIMDTYLMRRVGGATGQPE
ncbi:precorrin-6A synthase (deacetylating) [Rhodomicrobium lacus]|jgi:precorrin-6A synthase|uniref:precorrin-6A synthase (deacetylating) n=1 Tax=Rhodomicrobium lacus TaxID=2498452 RepID=UPI0026E431D1|nr:precorrin-6A synthase (deacetylating) [Rhodomicrobium lacus]WKW50037.1 precorrin-6A synthase (deacetylating) [Rhodomicrobium lacus]